MATIVTPSFPGPVPREALAFLESKGLKPSFDHRDVWAEEHAHAFTAAKAMSDDVLKTLHDATIKALREGQTLQQFRKELTPKLQKLGWWGKQEKVDPLTGEKRRVQLGSPRRLELIFDANMRTARAAGQWARIQRTKEFLPYLIYELGPAEHHRPLHVAWAGTILPVDHPWWATHFPPNGWRCHCHVRQVNVREVDRLGGVTPAPDNGVIEWVNPRTGEERTVPKGIDPGWETNPGLVRQLAVPNVPTPSSPALVEPSTPAQTVAPSTRAENVPEATAPSTVEPEMPDASVQPGTKLPFNTAPAAEDDLRREAGKLRDLVEPPGAGGAASKGKVARALSLDLLGDAEFDRVIEQFGYPTTPRVDEVLATLQKIGDDEPAYRDLARALEASAHRNGPESVQAETAQLVREASCSRLIRRWAKTSGDDDALAVAMQLAARDEFRLEGTSEWWWSSTIERARAEWGDNTPGLRRFLRAQYKATQRYLRAEGLSSATAIRGSCWADQPAMALVWNGEGQKTKVRLQPMSSFSADEATATGFADDERFRLLIGARIPIERVLSCSQTGFGCLHESELVVLGGEVDVWAVGHDDSTTPRAPWKAFAQASEK